MSPSGILRASGGYRVLEHESDFLVLCALPLGRFLAAAAIGFGVKAYLYSSVIHHALEAADPADLLRAEAVWPLIPRMWHPEVVVFGRQLVFNCIN